MSLTKIKKGLDLPLAGAPEQRIYEGNPVTQVALLGVDYPGLKPQFLAGLGDRVKLGQPLYFDKKYPRVIFTAPGTGRIVEMSRGEKRAFLSLVIKLEGDEEIVFRSFPEKELVNLTTGDAIELLLESGLWTALRARPFGHVADPDQTPQALFVTAMDTNPLAPDISVVLKGQEQDFGNGLRILGKLTAGKIYICKSPGDDIPTIDDERFIVAEFAGPHPAGLPGTHIHFLEPVDLHKQVWHINAEDVVAVGQLFTTGRLPVNRIIALGGPTVKQPRLVRTRLGANLNDLTAGELNPGENRVISGSVLHGHHAADELRFLGRYHRQVTAIAEDRQRELFGWLSPAAKQFSAKKVTLSGFLPRRPLALTTSTHGSERAIVPIGVYEKVMPLDILPTFLLRALAVADIEESEKLGCLELTEEDLALCTFVCPSKIDHGQNLRKVLNLIEKEG